jgi:hypothetical protein
MANFLLGKAAVLQSVFSDLLTGQPSDPPGVTFSMVDPLGVVTTASWTGPAPGSFSGASGLSRLSPGAFQFVTVPNYAGSPWRWSFLSTGTATPTEFASSFAVISAAAYPYPYGYCDMTDVQSRIQAGSWTPTKTGAAPTMQQAQDFILDGAVMIDTVLARTGYTIPLKAQSGQVIGQQVWLTLLDINAALTVAFVEKTRHGSQDMNEDPNATWWMTYADDRLARIESGDDNLSLFGLDGPFYPIADRARGMIWTGATDADGNATVPFFSRSMNIV